MESLKRACVASTWFKEARLEMKVKMVGWDQILDSAEIGFVFYSSRPRKLLKVF